MKKLKQIQRALIIACTFLMAPAYAQNIEIFDGVFLPIEIVQKEPKLVNLLNYRYELKNIESRLANGDNDPALLIRKNQLTNAITRLEFELSVIVPMIAAMYNKPKESAEDKTESRKRQAAAYELQKQEQKRKKAEFKAKQDAEMKALSAEIMAKKAEKEKAEIARKEARELETKLYWEKFRADEKEKRAQNELRMKEQRAKHRRYMSGR